MRAGGTSAATRTARRCFGCSGASSSSYGLRAGREERLVGSASVLVHELACAGVTSVDRQSSEAETGGGAPVHGRDGRRQRGGCGAECRRICLVCLHLSVRM